MKLFRKNSLKVLRMGQNSTRGMLVVVVKRVYRIMLVLRSSRTGEFGQQLFHELHNSNVDAHSYAS